MTESKKWTFFIAGVQHHSLHKVIGNMIEGDYLDLVSEPLNKFDPNAVRIEHDGTMLGYVPRKFSSEVSAALENEGNLQCSITLLDPQAKPWEQCEVVIEAMIEEESSDELDK